MYKKYNNLINLSFGILFFNLIMPILVAIFIPYTILYSEKMYFVIVELLIFNILNYIFFKIKNEKLKKILIFMSIFAYLPGYNIILLFTSLVYQSLNSKKERYILINIFNILAYFMWYFRVYFILFFEKSRYIDFYANTMLILLIITFILFLIFKKGIYKYEIFKNVFHVSVIGIVIHNFFMTYLFGDFNTLNFFNNCDIYKGLKNEIILKKLLNYFSKDDLILHSSIYVVPFLCFLIMFLFYYFNISIYEKGIPILIIVIFIVLYISLKFELEINIKTYFILNFLILMYTINHIKNKYYEIKE